MMRYQPASSSVEPDAELASLFVDELTRLSIPDRKRLKVQRAKMAEGIRRLIEDLLSNPRPTPKSSAQAEPAGLSAPGLGQMLTAEEGTARLNSIARHVAVEDWAGPLAGSSMLHREMGIPRSTLDHWHKRGDVVALLKGTRRHVFPTDQFLDGRPVKGLRDVVEAVGNARVAWFWLRQPNAYLGKRPLDLLRQDKVDSVIAAARSHFDVR